VLCELVLDDGRMMRLPDLRRFATEHGLPLVSIADLIAHRQGMEATAGHLVGAATGTDR
jgi:3,4-dihydroxy-2-butanone 4-phosphate synthase